MKAAPDLPSLVVIALWLCCSDYCHWLILNIESTRDPIYLGKEIHCCLPLSLIIKHMDLVCPFYARSSIIALYLLSFVVGRLSSRHEFWIVLRFAIRSSMMSSTSLAIANWLQAYVLRGAVLQVVHTTTILSEFHRCSSRFSTFCKMWRLLIRLARHMSGIR